ncbi:unnamed protein product [Phytomonas sp. Hart1]|nr:unnamed protein product [Phytomonas sp. Hart1]|eukprot:CCW68126.1 unnamed protein product [Phytomonas sp. isolate Hart1]
MPIVDRQSNRIDLSHQNGAVDASVLEHLRHALHLNSFFFHLDLSYNTLDSESASMLCTIFKDKNSLKTFSLGSCGITDKMFTFQLVPALCAREVPILLLDLSKNDGITDKSIDALCHFLQVANILDLRLSGTKINPKSAKVLLKALESNTTLEHLELPFTVGFGVLNRAKVLLRRNLRLAKDVNHLELEDNTKALVRHEVTPLGSPSNDALLGDGMFNKFSAIRNLPSLQNGSFMRGLDTFNRPRKVSIPTSSSDAIFFGGNGKATRSQLALANLEKNYTARETTDRIFLRGKVMPHSNQGLERRGPYWRQRLQDVYDTLNLSDPVSTPVSYWADPALNRSLKCLCFLEGTL